MTGHEKAKLLLCYRGRVASPSGITYEVRAYGEPGSDRLWRGWLAFFPPFGSPVVTDSETTQPSEETLVYWATGLRTTYFEGALKRALDREQRTWRC
jgi:hypothetical protein